MYYHYDVYLYCSLLIMWNLLQILLNRHSRTSNTMFIFYNLPYVVVLLYLNVVFLFKTKMLQRNSNSSTYIYILFKKFHISQTNHFHAHYNSISLFFYTLKHMTNEIFEHTHTHKNCTSIEYKKITIMQTYRPVSIE